MNDRYTTLDCVRPVCLDLRQVRYDIQHSTYNIRKNATHKKIDVRLNSIAPEMCISAQDKPGHRKAGLEFHFRYAENGRQTGATEAACRQMGRNCVAFFINNLA